MTHPPSCMLLPEPAPQPGIPPKPRGGRPPAAQRQREALRRFHAGEDPSQIAASLQVTRGAVVRWLRRQGVSLRVHPQREEALALLRTGVVVKELAAQLGLSAETLSRWAKEAGVPLRRQRGQTLSPARQRVLGLLLSGVPQYEIAAQQHESRRAIRELRRRFLSDRPPRSLAPAPRLPGTPKSPATAPPRTGRPRPAPGGRIVLTQATPRRGRGRPCEEQETQSRQTQPAAAAPQLSPQERLRQVLEGASPARRTGSTVDPAPPAAEAPAAPAAHAEARGGRAPRPRPPRRQR